MKNKTTGILTRFLRKSPLQRLGAILDRLPFRPFEVGLFYSLQAVGLPESLPRDFTVTIREGGEADLENLTRCVAKRERFLSRFRLGDRCLLALEGEEIVGFLWFCVREAYQEEMTGYRLAVPGTTVYPYDGYVSPAHRRRGILGQLYTVLYDWMAQHGRDTILILIFHDNDTSWQWHLKRGFTPLERILYLRVFGWRYYHVRSAGSGRYARQRP